MNKEELLILLNQLDGDLDEELNAFFNDVKTNIKDLKELLE